jgi:pantothenate kinase
VWAPSFDHALKDPVARAIRVGRAQRVVVLEGNYVLLQDSAPSSSSSSSSSFSSSSSPTTASSAWVEAAALLDERWFVAVDEGVAARRLVARHVAAGIAAGEDEAWERVRGNDLVNGREIVRCKGVVDEEVVSKEDAGWG